MALILLSGRPGAGKTAFGRWLAAQRAFTHVETDVEWGTWGQALCIQNPSEALATRDRAAALGARVIVEWGFHPSLLPSVQLLRDAGFDVWWFDGDEAAARKGYVQRRGEEPGVMSAYRVQLDAIDGSWPDLERFYGDHVIITVNADCVYVPFPVVAARILQEAP